MGSGREGMERNGKEAQEFVSFEEEIEFVSEFPSRGMNMNMNMNEEE